MSKPVFPYYSGNIKLTKVIGHVTIDSFTNAIGDPKPKIKSLINKIKNCNDSKEKRELKHGLYSFTPSVFIDYGKKRKYSSVSKYTGLMQIDLDGIDDYNIAKNLKQWVFEQPECVCSFLSPSNNVKALIRIVTPLTKDHYIRLWNAVESKYEETGYFDVATKNAVLPLFLSVDEDILYRDFNDAYPWQAEKELVIDHVALNSTPTSINYSDGQYYYEKTIRILTKKFNSINDNGHPQVRSAALILGSRVGAGYLTQNDAELHIISLIKQNEYLQKGIKGYVETAQWGIKQGMSNPRYY